MTVLCPCCNRPMEAERAPIEALIALPLSKPHRTVIGALVKAYPGSVRAWDLVDALYGHDPDGGPEDANQALASMMVHVRRRLAGTGWIIPQAKRGPKTTGYRLEPGAKP